MKTIKLIKTILAVLAIIVALKIADGVNPSAYELIASTVLVLLSVSVFLEDSIKKYY